MQDRGMQERRVGTGKSALALIAIAVLVVALVAVVAWALTQPGVLESVATIAAVVIVAVVIIAVIAYIVYAVLAVASRRPIEHPRVVNVGFHADVEKCYAAADATILASKYEAFGLVAVESILCGTPSLLSETCGATDALSAPACIKFPRTQEGVRAAVSLARERQRAGTLALADPERFVRYPFSLEKHVDALLALLA